MRLTMLLTISAAARASRFLIMRHGETNHNALGIIQGSSDDSRLTEQGLEQARAAGITLTGLTDISIDKVFVSPLTRAQQTLEMVDAAYSQFFFSSLPKATVISELREIDLGSWEGRDKQALKAAEPDAYAAWQKEPLAFEIDGGVKPIVNLWARSSVAWEQMRAACTSDERDADAVTLVVTHNALGQALLCTALGLDETFFRTHEFANCAALEVEWKNDAPRASGWRWRIGPKAPVGEVEGGPWLTS